MLTYPSSQYASPLATSGSPQQVRMTLYGIPIGILVSAVVKRVTGAAQGVFFAVAVCLVPECLSGAADDSPIAVAPRLVGKGITALPRGVPSVVLTGGMAERVC